MSFSVPKMESSTGASVNDPFHQFNILLSSVKQPLEAEINKLKEELQQKEKLLGESRQEIHALNEKVQVFKNDFNNQNLLRYQQDNNVLHSKVLTLTAENNTLNTELQTTQKELAGKNQKIDQTLNEFKTMEMEQQAKMTTLEAENQNLKNDRSNCNAILQKFIWKLDPTNQLVFAAESSCEQNLIKFGQLLGTRLFFHGAGILDLHQGFASLIRDESQVTSRQSQLPTPSMNSLENNNGAGASTIISDNDKVTELSAGLGDLSEPLHRTTEEKRDESCVIIAQHEESLPVSQNPNAPTTRRSGRLQNTYTSTVLPADVEKVTAKRKIRQLANRGNKKKAKKVKQEIDEIPAEMLVQHRKDKSEGFRDMHFCICGKEYVTEIQLKLHLNYFLPKKVIQCPRIVRKKRCKAVFRTSTALNQHCRQEHGNATSYVRCKLCDKLFTNQSKRLQHHRKMHQVDLTLDESPEITSPVSPLVDVDAATDSDGEGDMLA